MITHSSSPVKIVVLSHGALLRRGPCVSPMRPRLSMFPSRTLRYCKMIYSRGANLSIVMMFRVFINLSIVQTCPSATPAIGTRHVVGNNPNTVVLERGSGGGQAHVFYGIRRSERSAVLCRQIQGAVYRTRVSELFFRLSRRPLHLLSYFSTLAS